MTRRDEDGDLAGLTTADGLGFVNGEEMMDTPKTVEVPVELLKLVTTGVGGPAVDAIRALIPKPKPRLVAVNLNTLDVYRTVSGDVGFRVADIATQPDLLGTLDSVIDELSQNGRSVLLAHELKAALREKFGVDYD